jgi:hypothetical protein
VIVRPGVAFLANEMLAPHRENKQAASDVLGAADYLRYRKSDALTAERRQQISLIHETAGV